MALNLNARMMLLDIAEGRAKKKKEEELMATAAQKAVDRQQYYDALDRLEKADEELLRVRKDYAQEMQSVRANTPMVSSAAYKPGSMEEARAYEQTVYASPAAQKVAAWQDRRIAEIKSNSKYEALQELIREGERQNPELTEERKLGQEISDERIKIVDPFQDVEELKKTREQLNKKYASYASDPNKAYRGQQNRAAVAELDRQIQMLEDPNTAIKEIDVRIGRLQAMQNESGGYYEGLQLNKDIEDLQKQRALWEGRLAGNSASAETIAQGKSILDSNKNWLEKLYDSAMEYVGNNQGEGYGVVPMSAEDRERMEQVSAAQMQQDNGLLIGPSLGMMTEEEKNGYYALLSQDKDKAQQYLDAKQMQLNARAADVMNEQDQYMTETAPGLSNVISPLAEVAKPVGSVYSILQGMRGADIDPNARWYNAEKTQSVIRKTTKGMIAENIENPTWRTLATGAYDIIMGIADNTTRAAFTKWMGPMGSTAAMGFGTIGGSARHATENGANSRKALVKASVDALAEVVTEYLPTARLFGALDHAGDKTIKEVLLGLAAGMTEDGVGEGLSDLISAIADQTTLGKASDYDMMRQNYMLRGMSAEEATKAVFLDILKEAGYSAIIGAITGGVMQGGAEAVGGIRGMQNRRALERLRAEMNAQQEQEQAEAQQAEAQQEKNANGLREVAEMMQQEMTARQGTAVQVIKPGEEQAPQAEKTEKQKTVESIQTARVNMKRRKAAVEADEGDEGYIIRQGEQEVTLEDLDAESADAIMLNAAPQLSRDAANDMLSLYDESGEVTAENYAKGYEAAYAVGLSGEDLSSAAGLYIDDLTENQRKSAWLEGQNQRTKQETRIDSLTRRYATEAGLEARMGEKHRGVSLETVTRKLEDQEKVMLRLIDTVAKRYGVDVRVYDTLKGGKANGYIKEGTNVINLALDAQDGALTRVASHELYHFVEGFAKEDAKAIREFVLDKLRNMEGYDLEARKEEITELYQKNGVANVDAESEIVADAMLDIIGTEENLQLMARENKNLLQKIKEHLQSLMQFIRDTLSRAGRNSEEVRALQGDAAYLQEIIRRMDKALQNAQKNYAARAQATQTAMQNDMVQGYLQRVDNAKNAEERSAAADLLVQNLMYATQEKVIDATGDIDGTLEAFRDTLQRFANGEGQLDSLLQKAGLNATTDELRPVVAYAARALKNAGEEREVFSVQSLPDGRRYVEVDTDQEFFDGLSRTQMAKAARNYILDKWRGRLLGNNVQAYATRTTAKEFAYPANRRMDDAIKEAKLRSAPELENILDACYFAKSEVNTDQNKKHISSFDYYDVIVRAKGVWYTGVVNVAQTNVGPVFYDLSQLKENTGVVRTHGLAEEQDGASNTSAYNDIISADGDSVNGNSFSLKTDPETERRYQEIFEKRNDLQQEERQLEGRKRDFNNDEKTLALIDRMVAAETREERKAVAAELKAHEVEYGVAEIEDRLSEIKKERRAIEQREDELRAEELRRKVEASGKSEAEYFEKEAVKEFGYTPYFVDAGYILKNGKMLNFSGEKGRHYGMRGQDHRAVSTLFDGTKGPTESMNAFMGYGNVRIMDETPGVDIYKGEELTKEQLATIRKHVRESAGRDLYVVDFSDERGMNAGTLTYEGRVNAERVIADIQHYFQTGEVREQSELSKFHSLKTDTQTDYFMEIASDEDVREANQLIAQLISSRQKLGTEKDAWRGKTSAIAKKILEETGSEYGQGALTSRINKAYEAIDRAGSDRSAIMAYCYDIGKAVAAKAGELAEVDSGRQQARDYIRTTKVYLNPEMQSEVKATYGSMQAFMRRNFGKAKFTTQKNATGLEEMWGELHDMVPSVFKEDTALSEMPFIVEAFLESSGKVNRIYYNASEEQIAQDVAMRLFWEYFQMPGTYTHLQEQEKEMVQRISDTMDNLRDTFEQRVQERIDARDERAEKLRQRTMLERTTKLLARKLNRPTKENHIPEQYRGAVAEALAIVNTGGNRKGQEARTARYQALLQEIGRLKESDEDLAHIDPDLVAHIEELRDTAAGKSIMAMDLEELKTVNNVLQNLQHACAKSDKMLTAGRQMSTRVIAEGFHADMERHKDRKVKGNVGTAFEKLGRSMQDAPRFFNELARMGGESANELWDILRHGGLDTQMRLVQEAENKMQEALGESDYQKWYSAHSENMEFGTESGKINLTKGQVMALYLLNKRQQARNHIYGIKGEDGGIAQGRVKTKGGKYSESVRPSKVNEEQVQYMIGTLTAKEKAVADKMGAILSGWCAELGNEVSLQMYGYKKFNEENYFPIQVWDGRKSATSGEQFKNDLYQIMNKGFTKELQNKAQAPLVIPDIFDAVTEHINGMIAYRAWTAPVTDVIKFLNYKYTDDTTEIIDGVAQYVEGTNILGSVREDIDRVMGKAATEYMTQLLKDINGRSKNSVEKIWDKGVGILTRNQKSSAVAANIGTMMKQPFSITRAFDVIPAHYFAGKPIVPTKKRAELISKYAPIYYWKQQGNFTMDSGKSIQGILMPKLEGAKSRFNEWMMAGAGYMDNVTWHNIWAAAERMVNAKIKNGKEAEYVGLKAGTDAYYKKVAEIYNKCVDETQTVDSILHRTEVMRQDSALLKMLTSFMGEPMKTVNMLMDAVDDVRRGNVKKGRRVARIAGVLGVSIVVQEMVNAMVSTLRNWDDEDEFWAQFSDAFLGEYKEEMTGWEKVQEFWMGSTLGSGLNILTYIPVARDMMETFSGYTVERMDMALLSDMVTAVKQLGSKTTGDVKKVTNVLGAIGNLFGIPTGNIIKEGGRIWNYIAQQLEEMGVDTLAMQYAQLKIKKDLGAANLTDYAELILKAEKQGNTKLADEIRKDLLNAGAEETKLEKKLYELEVSGLTGMKASDVSYEKTYGALAEAMKAGDKKLSEQLRSALIAGGRTEEQINDGLKKYLKENDPRVMEAAKQKAAGNLDGYTSVFRVLRAEGFPDAVAKGAVNAAYNAMQTKETKTETKKEENGYTGTYDSTDLKIAVENGSGADAREIIEDLRKQGKSDTSIKSTLTSNFKPLYKQLMKGTASDKQAARKLKQTLTSLDLKNKYTEEAIEEWLEN